jgi:predicted lipoprotein with Yx(FWY)xxD motif
MSHPQARAGDEAESADRRAPAARRFALLGALTLGALAAFASPAAAVIAPIAYNGTPGPVSGGIELKGTIYTYESDTHYRFEYGTTTSYGASVPVPDGDAGTQSIVTVAQTVTGLQPGTTYHYRLVASNAGGTGMSPDATFSIGTAEAPPPSSGGGEEEPSSGGGSTSSKGGKVKLKVVRVKGRRILATSNGHTLYSLSAEKHGRFICRKHGGCLGLWHPLLVPAGTKPRGPVALGTVKRPEGGTQVTFRGHPLYSFTGDAKPGQVKGEGLKDVGTWHAVTVPRRKR